MTPALLAAGLLVAAGGTLTADLPDEVLARLSSRKAGPPAELLAAILAADPYEFDVPGLRVFTDGRWYRVDSVEGPGAPALELRRWPGDTVVAFYPRGPGAPTELVAGLTLAGATTQAAHCSVRDGRLETGKVTRSVLWAECRGGERRVGVLAVPGDAGFGSDGKTDRRLEILSLLGNIEVAESGPPATAAIAIPQLPPPPGTPDERRDAWQVFQGDGFTLGLPPGMRALRLASSTTPPRPMPGAIAWIRGRFVDRDGTPVAVGDGRRAGYVASVDLSNEAWRAGVAAPLGAPAAERLDEAELHDLVQEWTGASKAVVSHWKEPGFEGDWLVFRLFLRGSGVEIGLPVLSGWRSLALFWIPVTWRDASRPAAPPPIDPAVGLGVRFDRLGPAERARQGLVEGTLVVATLRLEIPRGYWPVANLGSPDGLPVTLYDAAGLVSGRIESVAPGSVASTIAGAGWTALPRPGSRKAASIHLREDGTCLVVARAGGGYLLAPAPGGKERAGAWRRLVESASIVKAARRDGASPPGRTDDGISEALSPGP